MSKAKHGPIDQIGIVVDDLDASIHAWIERMGVGPWTLFENVMMEGQCRGQPTSVTLRVAMGYQNGTQIELMEITNFQPSPYRNAAGTLLTGMHHFGWLVDDLDAAMAQARQDGLQLVFEAHNPAARVAYFEGSDQPGMMFEFIESAVTRQLIADGIAATRAWNGDTPITTIDLAAADVPLRADPV